MNTIEWYNTLFWKTGPTTKGKSIIKEPGTTAIINHGFSEFTRYSKFFTRKDSDKLIKTDSLVIE